MLEQHHIFTNLSRRKKIWHSESKLKTIIGTILVTKKEFPFKNELDYQIKSLKTVFSFNNFSGVLYLVICFLHFDIKRA